MKKTIKKKVSVPAVEYSDPRVSMTIRLSADLSKRAGDYATGIGISSNALVCLALSDFLRTRL